MAHISWTTEEAGAVITWIAEGDQSMRQRLAVIVRTRDRAVILWIREQLLQRTLRYVISPNRRRRIHLPRLATEQHVTTRPGRATRWDGLDVRVATQAWGVR